MEHKNQELTLPKSADPKITSKWTLRYMVQTLLGDLIDFLGDKNTLSDKKNPGLTFGQLLPGPRMNPKRAIEYLFKYKV